MAGVLVLCMPGMVRAHAAALGNRLACVGDCTRDSAVTVDELLTGTQIALGGAALSECPAFDVSGDRQVTVDELLAAVNAALLGCSGAVAGFPAGAYFWPDHAYGQTGSALGDLAQFGLNTVVAYYEYVKPDANNFGSQPDCHGLVREADLLGIDFFIGAPRGHQLQALEDEALAELLQATIECVGSSPRYQGWMFDEPELTGYDAALLRRVTGHLRGLDPARRVWVNFSPFATDEQVRGLGSDADLMGFDIYPVSDLQPRALGVVGEYTLRALSLAPAQAEIWMIVQAFGYSDLPNEGGQGRRPSPQELRFMAYDALAHGARGIIFFGSHQLRNTIPVDAALWDSGVRNVVRELGEIGSALLARERVSDVTAQPGSLVAARFPAADDLLIVVNTTSVPVTGVLTLPGAVTDAREIFDDRVVPVDDATLTDSFAAYGVHVYSLTR